MRNIQWCLAVVCLFAAVSAAPQTGTGTPVPLSVSHNTSVLESVCRDLLPLLVASPLPGPAPYVITYTYSNTTEGSGLTMQLTITGKNSTKFLGVIIQGFDENHENSVRGPLGQFAPSGPNTPPITLTNCSGNNTTASYISRQPITQLVLSFTTPDAQALSHFFRATIVKSFTEFWTGVESEYASEVEYI